MKLTVVIPCFNDWGLLCDEILRPLFMELDRSQAIYEVIVVDDGSPGLIAFDGAPVSGVRGTLCCIMQEHKGASAARNRAFEEGVGTFTLFMDADVTWQPWAITKMLRMIEDEKADVVYSKFKHGRSIMGKPYSQETLLTGNYIGGTGLIRSVMVPKDGWDETLDRLQDWDFWRRALIRDKAKPVFIDDVLFEAKRRPGISTGGDYTPWIEKVRAKEAEWNL